LRDSGERIVGVGGEGTAMKYTIAELRKLYRREIYPVEADMLDCIEAQAKLLAEARDLVDAVERDYPSLGEPLHRKARALREKLGKELSE
jgi:hypothetical protein